MHHLSVYLARDIVSSACAEGACLPEEKLSRPIILKNGNFRNPWPTAQETSFGNLLKWMISERQGSVWLENKKRPSEADLEAAFPVRRPSLSTFSTPPADAIRAVWVGHATLLVQMGGATFLTDPVFSNRCSPLSFAGPKRVTKTPFSLDDPDLPKIDFVLISHNHYDHLDYQSVKQLHKRFGTALKWYIPLRLGKWFEAAGIARSSITELDWWQQVQHEDPKLTIALTPAQHWSNRGTDRMHTLWGGFAVFTKALRFYFVGDSGYCSVFPEIAAQYGPFDLAAIPVGAYEPRWFMKFQHVNPEEAVRIHKEVNAKRSVAIHLCTFHLTDEAIDAPPRLLVEESRRQGLSPEEFVALPHGGEIVTSGGRDVAPPPLLEQFSRARGQT